MEADNPVTVAKEGFCNRTDDSVHARSRTATTKDDNGIFHKFMLKKYISMRSKYHTKVRKKKDGSKYEITNLFIKFVVCT